MARRDLPPNTYCRRGYYSWRNPRTREEFGLGSNKASAIVQAVEANLHLAKLDPRKPRLIDRLTGNAERSVEAWSDEYGKYLRKRDLADNTRRAYASMNRKVVELLGADTAIRSVTALMVSGAINRVVDDGKARAAQALRHFMRDWFREAILQGWRDDNPVRDTKLGTVVKVKRARLQLEVFQAVHAAERRVWARNAYMLALVGGQRREDNAAAKFADFRDGGWWLTQLSEKSTDPHRIFIPLDLKLEAVGRSLGDVVADCRRTGVLSPYLIHQTERCGRSKVGSPIFVDTISRAFTETLGRLGLDFGDKEPPTYHEIRSLSERLYSAQGGVSTQHLLGHTDPSMTALYHSSRGDTFVSALDGSRVVTK